MIPAWRLDVEGEDVTDRVREHLVELRVTLTSDTTSDTLQITLSDVLGVLARPAAERELRLSLGYRATGLTALGVYRHSETDVDLAPRRMVLRATAADLTRETRKIAGHYRERWLRKPPRAGDEKPELGGIRRNFVERGNRNSFYRIDPALMSRRSASAASSARSMRSSVRSSAADMRHADRHSGRGPKWSRAAAGVRQRMPQCQHTHPSGGAG